MAAGYAEPLDLVDDSTGALMGRIRCGWAYASTFIAIFFNVALAACAVRSMRGEDTRVAEALSTAARRIVPILGWTLVRPRSG